MDYPYFKDHELRCKCGECGKGGEAMDFKFMQKLHDLRLKCGFPFPVTSAYRCPEHNQAVSSTGPEGPHTTGRAIDIAVSYDEAFDVLKNAADCGFTGIGVQQSGDGRFIHLDDFTAQSRFPRPTVWSY